MAQRKNLLRVDYHHDTDTGMYEIGEIDFGISGELDEYLKKYNQHRRDCDIDLECEGCGHQEIKTNAYDDRNFWDNVVPDFKCDKCKKSSKDLGIENERIGTRYAAHEVV